MVYEFGACQLDVALRELRVDGVPLAVEPQVFDLLLYLIENRTRVVSKDDLLAAIWKGRIVSESTLSSRISAARKAIRDADGPDRVIRNIPRKGFRFVADVSIRSTTDTARVADPVPVETADPSVRALPVRRRERRPISFLTCCLGIEGAGDETLDLEDSYDVLATCHATIDEVCAGFDAKAQQAGADAVRILLGYPVAAEDFAERAVRIAIVMMDRLAALDVGSAVRLHPAIGIASGSALVVPEGDADGLSIVGDVETRSRSLAEAAPAGAVYVDDVTRGQARGLFRYRSVDDAGQRRRRGAAWRVVGEHPRRHRFDALRSPETPMVGREEELGLLEKRWRDTARGEGHVAIVWGEAGIGKSRLIRELCNRAAPDSPLTLALQCSPFHQGSAYYPLAQLLMAAARIAPGDDDRLRIGRLRDLLDPADAEAERDALAISSLVTSTAEAPREAATVAERVQSQTLAALLRQLERICALRRVLLVVEDAHWIDPTTLKLLTAVVERAASLPILVLVSARPTLKPPWEPWPHVLNLSMARLDQRSGRALVCAVAGADGLPEPLIETIVARSTGVPLFIEELAGTAIAAARTAGGPAAALHLADGANIPHSLHASLLSRYDRLDAGRHVAMIAAAIGSTFSYAAIAQVVDHDADALARALAELADADLVFQRGTPPDATYKFRHILVRDAIYATMTRDERRYWHTRIADALAKQADPLAGDLELIAYHYTEAGRSDVAIDYWLRAGQEASRRSALVEAAALYGRGLECLGSLGEEAQRRRLEMELQLRIAPVLTATSGYVSDAARAAYQRAHDLAEPGAGAIVRLDILFGIFNAHYVGAEIAKALDAANAHAALARSSGLYIGRAHTLVGQVHAARGAIEEARNQLLAAILEFAREPERPAQLDAFPSQEVVAHAIHAGVLYALGDGAGASAATARSVELAERLDHPLSRALAMVTRLYTPVPGGPSPDAKTAADVVAFCRRARLQNFEVMARFAEGAVRARLGDTQAGIAIMNEAISRSDLINSRLMRPAQLGTLARAHLRQGDHREAVSLLRHAIDVANATGEQQGVAALHEALAKVLAASGREAEAREQAALAMRTANAQGIRVGEAQARKARGKG